MIIILPDQSIVKVVIPTMRFAACSVEITVSDELVEPINETSEARDINFELLADYMSNPFRKFGECFRRICDIPRYSPIGSVHDFDVRYLTKIYEFPGTYQGGTFSSSEREWRFLDGGIVSHSGYGWGSQSWTVVQGTEALRAICLFFGIQQPLRIKGEVKRRRLSELLEEMTSIPQTRLTN